MRQTLEGLVNFANRFKLIAALGALFMSGALFSLTVCAWYYDRVISSIHGSYGGRIAAHNKDMRRVQKELDTEREITRKQMQDTQRQLEEQANDIDKLSDDVGRLLIFAKEVSGTAKQAAATARSAATTAQGAAANAARSRIQVKEIEPEPTPEAPEWMDTP